MHREKRISRWRLLVQTGSFLVILLNPFLNYYLQINFIQGWYQSLSIGKLWFVSPLEGIETILVSKLIYMPLIIGMAGPIILALLLGRVFCGWICPINYFSDIIDRICKIFSGKRFRKDRVILPKAIFWYALAGELLFAMILGAPLFVFLSPPGLVGREIMMAVFFHTLALEGVVVLIVLGLNLITRRFFCRYLCPLGALLAFLGTKRQLLVVQDQESCKECGLCDRACPLGLSPSYGEAESSYCWNCGECIDICEQNALNFRWKGNGIKKEKLPAHSLPEDEPGESES
ncbi:MAG: nitrate reductase [Desulfobacterales bacterium S5133MH4]|nr:MAG: nitrate reductase [Desulfobacterales bacterium S5133MH4]